VNEAVESLLIPCMVVLDVHFTPEEGSVVNLLLDIFVLDVRLCF